MDQKRADWAQEREAALRTDAIRERERVSDAIRARRQHRDEEGDAHSAVYV